MNFSPCSSVDLSFSLRENVHDTLHANVCRWSRHHAKNHYALMHPTPRAPGIALRLNLLLTYPCPILGGEVELVIVRSWEEVSPRFYCAQAGALLEVARRKSQSVAT